MRAREPPWEQNGLPPIVQIMRIASANSRSVRGPFHKPALMGSCLIISHPCLTCLPSRWVKSLYSTNPYDWTDGGFIDIFLNGEYCCTSVRSSRCHSVEWVWNLKTKLCSIACDSRISLQGFHIRNIMFQMNQLTYISGLIDSKSEFKPSGPGFFPGRGGYGFAFQWFSEF